MLVGNHLKIEPVAGRSWVPAFGQAPSNEQACETRPIYLLCHAIEEVVHQVNFAGECVHPGGDEVGVISEVD